MAKSKVGRGDNMRISNWNRSLLSHGQCVVRNAKLSQCETVRNVSHGLR